MSIPNEARKYGNKAVIGMVYELSDFTTLSDKSVQRLQAIIDETFGREENPPEHDPRNPFGEGDDS